MWSCGRTDAGVELRVTDDGIGFVAAERAAGLGLRSIDERVRLAGGVVSVESQPGRHDGAGAYSSRGRGSRERRLGSHLNSTVRAGQGFRRFPDARLDAKKKVG